MILSFYVEYSNMLLLRKTIIILIFGLKKKKMKKMLYGIINHVVISDNLPAVKLS